MTGLDLAVRTDADTHAGLDLSDESSLVREVLAALGRLLGASLERPARDLRTFVSRRLGVGLDGVVTVKADLPGADAALVQCAVARLLDRSPDAVLTDDTATGAPGYDLIAVDVDEQVVAPYDLAAYIPPRSGFGFDAVIVLTSVNNRAQIRLQVRRDDAASARTALAELLREARGPGNFLRGKTVRAASTNWELLLTPLARVRADRATVIHPKRVWDQIDTHVGGLVRHGALLTAVGLGASRGLLIAGPPGVGKTALCRVIAAELPAGTTIIIVDSSITPFGVAALYDSLPTLAPAAVFFDDIDLLVGDRRKGGAGPVLGELLTHLDGMAAPAAVLTVATTNDTSAIDPALIRCGRFDAVIEIGPPDRAARAVILRRYLAGVADIDPTAVAAVTDSATGADLREIVRRAVLERGTEVTVADLLDIVADGRWKPSPPVGQYL